MNNSHPHMSAIFVDRSTRPERLKMGSLPVPSPGPGFLLVKVSAAGVNRADILQRKGLYPAPDGESEILGLEVAGVIAKTGTGCGKWRSGDRVFGLLAGGGYAQYALLHQGLAMSMPPSLSFPEAAAIPEAFLTAFQALCWLGNLQPGQWVLIHAGASGVGTAAIQLSRMLGAKCIVTAGSKEKIAACSELGAEKGILYKQESFQEPVLDLTRGRGVNVILDFIGEPFWEQNMNVLADDGKLVVLAAMGGSVVDHFDFRWLIKKRITLAGSTLRNRSLTYKRKLTSHFARFALPHFASGELRPVVDKIWEWQAVSEAHRYMEENRNKGKIILEVTRI